MHALGWALIHSLWQAVGVAGLALGLMAFSRRPSVRYLVGVGALALMLAAPVATFLVLMKPVAPVHTVLAVSPQVSAAAVNPPVATRVTLGAAPMVSNGVAIALEETPKRLLPSSILPWLVGAWLFGVALFSLRLAGGFLLLEHRRRRHSAALGPRVLAVCQELQHQLGLARAIRYLECGWLQAPAVIGWLRPVVLLPVTALTGLSEVQLRAVIAHELAHVRRLDALVNLFQVLVETLLFYHPAVWWLSRRIRTERELACDEIAVALTGDRLEYARALTVMAAWQRAPRLVMAANRGPLTMRILHILGRKPSGAGQRMLGLTGSVLFLAAALGAANALFGIAYPIPAAHAQARIKAALVSSQAAVDHIARQVLEVTEPAAIDATADQSQSANQPEKLVAPSPDLSRLVPVPKFTTPTVLASNDMPAPAQPPAQEAPAGSVQVSSGNPAAAPTMPGSIEPPIVRRCDNSSVSSRVISSDELLVPYYFICYGGVNPDGVALLWGGPALEDCLIAHPGSAYNQCPFVPTIKVQFADPADAGKMQPGKSVTLAGDIVSYRDPRIVPLTEPGGNTRVQVGYLTMRNARVVDRFGQSAPDQHASNGTPAATVASNDQLAAHTQSVTQAPPARLVQTASAEPATVTQCHDTSVFGRVISPRVVLMQGFTCFAGANGNGSAGSPNDIRFGSCPLASTTSAHRDECKWDVTLNVQLANPADAAKMVPGKVVRLGGSFHVTRQGQTGRVAVTNATILFADYYWGRNPIITCRPAELAALSRETGSALCVQQDILDDLKAKGPALAMAARSPFDNRCKWFPSAIQTR
ncbi:MAG TPA: M56 family metallopeptidase [Rhizomicrobium sp.]|nr:M56 family metallopeptidase [Rhizomicrobium sp.]